MKIRKMSVLLVLVAAVAVMGFSGPRPAYAFDPLFVDAGPLRLHLPLQNVSATQMYEFKSQKGFTGAETLLASHGDYGLLFGAATDYTDGIRFPFVALQTHLSNKIVSIEDISFAVWFGHDYAAQRHDRNKWGIAASTKLW